MALYTKYGRKILNDSIMINGDCFVGDKVIRIRALVEGRTAPRLFYLTDILADNGKAEIDDVIRANLKNRQ